MEKVLKIFLTMAFLWSMVASSLFACACAPSNQVHHCCEKKVSSHCPKMNQQINPSQGDLCQCPSTLEAQLPKKQELIYYPIFLIDEAVFDLDYVQYNKKFSSSAYQIQNLPPGPPIFLEKHTFIL